MSSSSKQPVKSKNLPKSCVKLPPNYDPIDSTFPPNCVILINSSTHVTRLNSSEVREPVKNGVHNDWSPQDHCNMWVPDSQKIILMDKAPTKSVLYPSTVRMAS